MKQSFFHRRQLSSGIPPSPLWGLPWASHLFCGVTSSVLGMFELALGHVCVGFGDHPKQDLSETGVLD